MSWDIRELQTKDFPKSLREIHDCPRTLRIAGGSPIEGNKILTVVGSRKYSTYAKEVCRRLIESLRGYPITLVSGLALGIDTIAHESALDVGLQTIAVPGSGLEASVLYPRSNLGLAKRIVENNGALISEYADNFKATNWSFPKRNRIMAGVADAVLIIEAEEKSGTLVTARLGMEYNREVLVIPSDINRKSSVGGLRLLKDGAKPVLGFEDILESLNIPFETPSGQDSSTVHLTEKERVLLEVLSEPRTREDVYSHCKLPANEISITLSTLEIKNIIKESGGKIWII